MKIQKQEVYKKVEYRYILELDAVELELISRIFGHTAGTGCGDRGYKIYKTLSEMVTWKPDFTYELSIGNGTIQVNDTV